MNIFAQIKREFAAFFYSPIAYVVIAASAILNGIMFVLIIDFLSGPQPVSGAPMEMMFSWILFWVIVMVLTPMITMRSLAEEKHSGTLETLLTAPISDTQVVLAKYISAVCFYIILWSPTFLYPFLLSKFSPVDAGPIISGYLGTFGVGMTFLSIGIFCSAITKNQIIAALSTFALMMVLFLTGLFGYTEGVSTGTIFSYVNLLAHMEDFAKGIVDSRHLVYYGSVIVLCLFCTVQVIQARRWRG